MKALLIGGTGTISTDVTRFLLANGWDVTLLNRGLRENLFPAARQIIADMNDEAAVCSALRNERFDVIADFICFTPDQALRDVRLFTGKTRQMLFVSSASAYQKPLVSPVITESTPLCNPYWQYSRDKAACEEVFLRAFREDGFPVTIVRPSHTFCEKTMVVPLHGRLGAWQVLKRIREGKRVLVPGDGNSLWAVMSSEDFAPAFAGLMGNIHAIGQAVQITAEELLTWNQILQVIADAVGGPYRPCYVPSALLAQCAAYDFRGALLGDKSNTVIFDNAKLHALVPSFRAQYRFDQAAPRSVRYFLTHPEAQRDDADFDRFCDRVVEVMERAEREIAAL